MSAPSEDLTEIAAPTDEGSPKPAAGPAEVPPPPPKSDRGLFETALGLGRPLILILLFLNVPLLVFSGADFWGISFGYRSFTRNLGLLAVLAMALRVPGLPWPRSPLLLPFVAFLVAIWASVALNGGRWGDVRGFGFALGLFLTGASLATSESGRGWLFHWLGALVLSTLLVEVAANPAILGLRESLRNTMVTAHPNTLGALFAVLAPIFVGGLADRKTRPFALLYLGCALVGAALTFSRLALAGLFLGSGAVLLLNWGKRHPVRVGLAALLAAGVAFVILGTISLGRFEADWQRLRIMQASLSLFVEHALFGIGYGAENLSVVFPARYQELYGEKLWLFHSHNMYVDLLVGAGLIGTCAGGWFFYRLARVGRLAIASAAGQPQLQWLGSGFAASVAVFFFLGVGDMPLYHERLLFPLAVAWGLMDGWVRRGQTRPS